MTACPYPHPARTRARSSPGPRKGIGEALANELAARGHHLIITARRGDVLQTVADRITARYGVTVEIRPVDLTDPNARRDLGNELAERNIRSCATTPAPPPFGPVAALDPEGERDQVALNVNAVHDLTLAVLPGMIGRAGGGILISGSAAGNSPIPNNATYAASKAFANTFSESLRGEVKKDGVHVTLLAPGSVRTRTARRLRSVRWSRSSSRSSSWIDTGTPPGVAGCPGAQQDAGGTRPDVQGHVGRQRLRAPRAVVAPIVGAVYKARRRPRAQRRRPVPKMLRVISRPNTVPAERIALLKAGLSTILSKKPGCGGAAGGGIGGTSTGASAGGRSGARGAGAAAAGASLAASIS